MRHFQPLKAIRKCFQVGKDSIKRSIGKILESEWFDLRSISEDSLKGFQGDFRPLLDGLEVFIGI